MNMESSILSLYSAWTAFLMSVEVIFAVVFLARCGTVLI
jgi:hypothetical protein